MQVARQLVGIVPQENGANAPVALGNKDRPERAFANGKADFGIGAASTIVARRHAQNVIRLFVETAVGIVAGIKNGIGHGTAGATVTKFITHPLLALCRRVLSWGQSGDVLENAVKMIGTHPDALCQFFQDWRGLRFLDDTAGLRDFGCVLFSQRGPVRLAAFAGPEARLFGFFACFVKTDILRPCQAGRARRTAVHARGSDRVIEPAVSLQRYARPPKPNGDHCSCWQRAHAFFADVFICAPFIICMMW